MYNLGLDYERKRQFNKAASVFKFIQRHDDKYNDVAERITQNESASNTVVLRGTTGPARDAAVEQGRHRKNPSSAATKSTVKSAAARWAWFISATTTRSAAPWRSRP